MNKTAIKNFAVWARRKLIEEVTHKAYEVGITEEGARDIETFAGGFRVKGQENGKTFKQYEINQRVKLIKNINEKGFAQVIEEVAYTWFNRFIALRFMEVNNYHPTGVRVLSSAELGKTEPDIIREALNTDLDVNRNIIFRLQDSNETEDLFKYLLIRQCNQLGKIMPAVFEEIADYTELLLPDKLLSEGSVIRELVESIEEYDWKIELDEEEKKLEEEKGEHGIEIIGWLYQYYISEKKDEVFSGLKKKQKITKENIPAATQLFTPKWIVKYMVENSLGRLWLESHPNADLQANWKYYLEEAEQVPEVRKKLDELKNPDLKPEDIKFLDPAMGSGHILTYAFDVLYDIYLTAGYSERDIPTLILESNLYGLEICDRAGQLAAFSLLMKARSKNRRIFRGRPKLNLCSIQQSNEIPKEAIDYLVDPGAIGLEESVYRKEVEYLIEVFHDAKEYGSILDVQEIDFEALERRIEELKTPSDLFESQYRDIILEKLPLLIKQAKIMCRKYDVVCTNPPYMGHKGMNNKLAYYVNNFFPNSKKDLFAVFMEKCNKFVKKNSFLSMITQQSWLFLSSYERLRINFEDDIISMIQLGAKAFEEIGGEIVQTVSFVFRKSNNYNYKSIFYRLVDYPNQYSKEKAFIENRNVFYSKRKYFNNLPGYPISYWTNDEIIKIFKEGSNINEYVDSFQGIITGNNEKFLRLWYEVSIALIPFNASKMNDINLNQQYWIPYNKGGDFRKWYGNQEYIVFWKNGPKDKTRGKNTFRKYYLREYVSWSYTVSTTIACRYYPNGFLWDVRGSGIMDKRNCLYYLQALISSKVGIYLLKIINSTLSCQVENILKIPTIIDSKYKLHVDKLVKQNINISKTDWDSFETSWDYQKHPLLTHKQGAHTIEDSYNRWLSFAEKQFNHLKQNEEELNRIFIDIYGLQDELTPEVEDKDITINKADRERDIKSFLSYAVGCMFGRYSLDEEGLIYAGGDFAAKFRTENGTWQVKTKDGWEESSVPFAKDNIIPLADGDYFEDDILQRFVEFVKTAFGDEALEVNLKYIAETLGKKANETSRQAIRRYFLKDFYKDHVRTYKKRPIYWLFDSGKQNGFKALIYLHRYDPFTVARVRTDYLHRLQQKYEAEVNHLDIIIDSDISEREKVAARKKKEVLLKQIQECRDYDQVIAHVANQKLEIDLDDGVKINYAKFQGVEIPRGEGRKTLKTDLLANI